jgi:hypothetical protein
MTKKERWFPWKNLLIILCLAVFLIIGYLISDAYVRYSTENIKSPTNIEAKAICAYEGGLFYGVKDLHNKSYDIVCGFHYQNYMVTEVR